MSRVLLALLVFATTAGGASAQLAVEAVATGLDAPTDAAPSPDGSAIYFVTDGASGSGLYRVVAGGPPERLADFVHARGVVVSADGETVYVGDAAGGLWAVSVGGGAPALLRGTGHLAVHHLDRPHHLLFVGEAPDGSRAVYTLAPRSGRPRAVVPGLPGTVTGAFALGGPRYVVATVGDDGAGALHRVTPRGLAPLVTGVTLGVPTGMALAPDGETLMVSSLSAAGTAQVLLVDTETGGTSVFDDVIGANEAAGGLHRAADTAVWAWADHSFAGRGSVYRITLE